MIICEQVLSLFIIKNNFIYQTRHQPLVCARGMSRKQGHPTADNSPLPGLGFA